MSRNVSDQYSLANKQTISGGQPPPIRLLPFGSVLQHPKRAHSKTDPLTRVAFVGGVEWEPEERAAGTPKNDISQHEGPFQSVCPQLTSALSKQVD